PARERRIVVDPGRLLVETEQSGYREREPAFDRRPGSRIIHGERLPGAAARQFTLSGLFWRRLPRRRRTRRRPGRPSLRRAGHPANGNKSTAEVFMKRRCAPVCALLVGLSFVATAHAQSGTQSQPDNPSLMSEIETVRAEVRADRQALVA